MYRLSQDADLSFFVDVDLLQVCVGRNELILNFDRNVNLTMLSTFAVGDPDGASVTCEESLAGVLALFPLICDSVTKAEATPDGGLLLLFRSGRTITVFDDSDQYESFWIGTGEAEIIV